MPPPRRRGLGVANPKIQEAGSITGAGAGIASTIMLLAGATGPAAPIVAIAGAVVALITSFIGGGCGQACIQAAQGEQIYEIATDNISAVSSKLGMIDRDEFIAGAQQFLNAGIQHMEAIAGRDGNQTKQAKNGQANMQKQISQMISAASGGSLSATRSAPLDVAKAQAVFIGGSSGASAGGWYSGAVSAGAQLATAYLESLPPTLPSGVSSSSLAAGITSLLPGSAGGFSIGTLALWGVGIYAAIKLLGAIF
jgi:hypothetical protein